ncbi:MAG: hypothetical protein ACI8PZ_006045 [Myxococcota bacterium]|jgi:hypothetical protein
MRAQWIPMLALTLSCGDSGLDDKADPATTWTPTPTTITETTGGRDSGGFTTTTEDTGPCVFPDVAQAPAGPGIEMAIPQYLGLRFTGMGWDREIVDFTSPNNGDQTATIDFVFYDDTITEMCIVRYDASPAIAVNPLDWPADNGTTLYSAWQLILREDPLPDSGIGTPSIGWTNCGEVNEFAGFGSRDLRDWLETLEWGFGLGPMVNVESTLATAVNDAGLDWTNDWAPYVFGFYVWTGDVNSFELGYTFAGDHNCELLDEISPGVIDPIPEPLGPPMNDFYIGSQFFLFDLFIDPPTDSG